MKCWAASCWTQMLSSNRWGLSSFGKSFTSQKFEIGVCASNILWDFSALQYLLFCRLTEQFRQNVASSEKIIWRRDRGLSFHRLSKNSQYFMRRSGSSSLSSCRSFSAFSKAYTDRWEIWLSAAIVTSYEHPLQYSTQCWVFINYGPPHFCDVYNMPIF